MFATVPKIFKNAIYQDLLKYSDPNGSYVASEEALRILVHFVFKDDLPEPEIIPSSKIDETLKKFKHSKKHHHKQYIIEYGNRSIKTPGDPDTIHYAAMNLYLEGQTVIALIADHYNGIHFYNHETCALSNTENIKLIFLGGMLYQADHNHCLIFSIHHLILSRKDEHIKAILLNYIEANDPELFKLKMSWLELPLVYNLDIQSASFYFKKYMSLLLEKPNGKLLYQQMREFIEENFVVVSEKVEIDMSGNTENSTSSPKKTKFLKLLNRGICFKTTDLSIEVHRKIEALEQNLNLIMIEYLREELPLEIIRELQTEFDWQDDVDYLDLSEAKNISLQGHMEELKEFILNQDLNIANLRKGVLISSSLLVNLYLLEVAYANNLFFYDILSSSLLENFSFYQKLIRFESRKLAEFFPQPTFDFKRACIHYNPEHLFKALLKNFIRKTKSALINFSYNVFYDKTKEEYIEELIERTEYILFLFNPIKKMDEYQEIFNDWQVFIECCLTHSYCFNEYMIQFLRNLESPLRALITQLNSFQEVRFTRDALVHSEAFAVTFVSSHPLVEFLFNNSPFAFLHKTSSQPKKIEQARVSCASPTKISKAKYETSGQTDEFTTPRKSPILNSLIPGLGGFQAIVKPDNHFSKIRTIFLSPLFQLSAKIDLFELKNITGAILNSHSNSVEINVAKLNEIYSHFNHIQLLLTHVLNGQSVVLSKSEIEYILLNRKGSCLKYLVVNQALIKRDLSFDDLETHREVIRNSKFIETENFELYETEDQFNSDYQSLLIKTGKSSPVSVASQSLFASSHPSSPIDQLTLNTQGKIR